MDEFEPLKYIQTIVLEILNRSHQLKKKFNVTRFNSREVAYAFLRQYDREHFVKKQKITVWYNNQELYLCVRDLIYGKNSRMANTNVEFIYRTGMFSEIKWSTMNINRINRVRWANDGNESSILKTKESFQNQIPEIHFDGDYTSINVDEPVSVAIIQVLPSMVCNTLNDDQTSNSESFCRHCRMRQSVSDLEKLINNNNEENLTLEHDKDNESHFRSSIYVRVNSN